MVFLSLFAVLSLVIAAEGSVGLSTNSSFCTESKECLEYELLCKTDEYEVRHYSPTRWVSTDAEAYFMGVGAAMAFRRLFQYITGANVGGIQMEMTAPVLVKIPEETKMWEPAVYTLNFPLPAAYQDKPPAPTNDKLYFTEMSEMDVYVRSYGGWMLSVTSRLHAHLLTKELQRVRASYNHSFHYGVGYDSPLKLLNRHNEVWYVAEGEPVCKDPQEPTPAHTPRQLLTPSPSDSPSDPPSNPSSDSPTDPPSKAPTDPPSDSLPQFQADPPSEPLALALADPLFDPLPQNLSDSASAPPSNLSSTSNSSSQILSDFPSNLTSDSSSDSPAVPPSNAPPSPSSAFSPLPTSTQMLLNQTANSSAPSLSPWARRWSFSPTPPCGTAQSSQTTRISVSISISSHIQLQQLFQQQQTAAFKRVKPSKFIRPP